MAGWAQQSPEKPMTVVKPTEIDEVLNNPGIGFMTFQRFNGDALNEGTGWTEGNPIVYQEFHGSLANKDYPPTSIAYFRIYWRFIEPEKGQFRWDLIDKALETARQRGQTLMLRIAPYGTAKENDVPEWYRKQTGEAFPSGLHGGWQATTEKWATNPENPAYTREFGGMIRQLGERYDGNPDLELVDIATVGAWGEGAGSELLSTATRESLLDSYLDSFHKTPLVLQPGDKRMVAYTMSRARRGEGGNALALASGPGLSGSVVQGPPVGWRADCLGDMGGFSPTENIMTDIYPQAIVGLGLSDAWKTAPVSMEACWVMQHWKNNGWNLKYIMDQSIKWHMSSFNAKSSPVPAEWDAEVKNWLNRMGYRFVLRRFAYSSVIGVNRKLQFTSWWENKGNAPAYRGYRLALRLRPNALQPDASRGNGESTVLVTDANIRSWMPGDSLYDDAVFLPPTLEDGDYKIDLALLDPLTNQPKIKLAIAGAEPDGWYAMGTIKVQIKAQIKAHAPEANADPTNPVPRAPGMAAK